jgi:hypothetical protein
MLLPLAEKMISKFISEGKIESDAEVQLYLMVLEMQNKHNAALDAVNGPLGDVVFLPKILFGFAKKNFLTVVI